jgi:hypothetical protein
VLLRGRWKTVSAVAPGMSAQVRRPPAGTQGPVLSLLSDLPKRLEQGTIALEVPSALSNLGGQHSKCGVHKRLTS